VQCSETAFIVPILLAASIIAGYLSSWFLSLTYARGHQELPLGPEQPKDRGEGSLCACMCLRRRIEPQNL
jgi:hypothetical protein